MEAWKKWMTYKTLRKLVDEATAQEKDKKKCTENHSGISVNMVKKTEPITRMDI
jgi:hypothetical protein